MNRILIVLAVCVKHVVGITNLVHSCMVNGTIEVQHPLFFTHLFAVQEEGTSAAVKCSVDTSGFTSYITGCEQGKIITAFFSNRSGDVVVFGSNSYVAYDIECRDIPDEGVYKTVANGLAVSLEATTQDSVTPSFVITSALRQPNQLGNVIYSAMVSEELYWTIDIPVGYSALPTCTAYSGTDDSGYPSKLLIQDGCRMDSDILGQHFDGIDTSIPSIKRYYTRLYVFKFYNSEDIYFKCSVKLCPSGSPACDLSCSKRRRGITYEVITDVEEVFTTGNIVHVLPKDRPKSAASKLGGSVWVSAVLMIVIVNYRC